MMESGYSNDDEKGSNDPCTTKGVLSNDVDKINQRTEYKDTHHDASNEFLLIYSILFITTMVRRFHFHVSRRGMKFIVFL